MFEEGAVEPTITVECSGQRASVELRGDLDLQVEDELTRTISVAASEPGIAEIHLDAPAVTFIDSSGLRALLVSRQVALDRGLAYSIRIASPGRITRLIAISGLEEVLVADHVRWITERAVTGETVTPSPSADQFPRCFAGHRSPAPLAVGTITHREPRRRGRILADRAVDIAPDCLATNAQTSCTGTLLDA